MRDYRVTVEAVNVLGTSTDLAELAVNNPKPIAPTITGANILSESDTEVTIEFNWSPLVANDIATYRLWADETAGFTPTVDELLYDAISNSFVTVIQKVGGEIPPFFWRVAAVDVWGDDYTLTDEQDLTTSLEAFEIESGGLVRYQCSR